MKPTVKLIGIDGNAFMIIGACVKAAKKAKWDAKEIDDLMKEFTSGDYNNLLTVACKHFEVE